ncbi:hypothetical protein ACHQM5_021050 [Ranunculus cassubicifolius]
MIVTMDPSSRVYKTGAVLIDGKIIAQIGQSAQLYKEHKNDKDVILINLQGKFVLPGFINTHVHTNLQLARGMGNDVILSEWLGNRLFPFESFMTEQDAYIGALATGVELIRSGVTTYAEAGGQHVPGIARATEELGLRAALTQSVLNFDRAVLTGGKRLPVNIIRTADEIISSQEEMYKKFNGAADGRLRMWLGIRQITTSTDELLNRTRDKAKELHTGIHMHVSALQTENAYVRESRGVANGSGTVTYLEKIKLLDTNLLASVAVWVNDQEIGYMAKAGVKVSHCPANSMYTFGFSPIQQMLDAGITVSLATDGPANNRMSIIDEMYAASLHTKGRAAFYTGVTDPTAVPAEAVLKMVTIDGAKSLLWDKEIGSIETLKKADLIIVDPFIWTMEPILDSIGALVYSMRSENIESVMCDGKWLMKDRKLLTVDEKKVLQLGRKTGLEILKRANISIPQRMNFV